MTKGDGSFLSSSGPVLKVDMTKGDGSFLSSSGFKGRFVVTALDQDCAIKNVKTLYGAFEDDLNVFEEETEAGGSAYALFNAGEKAEDCHIKLAPRQNRGFFTGTTLTNRSICSIICITNHTREAPHGKTKGEIRMHRRRKRSDSDPERSARSSRHRTLRYASSDR